MSTIISSHKSALTIEQRQNALKMLDDGKSERAVAEFFNVGKGTINRIKSNRVAIQLHETGEIPENIRKRKHAVVWVSRAWNQVNARTISKCFANCGFGVAPVVPELPMIINPEEIQIQTEENDECGIFPPVISPEELFEEALNNVTQRQNAHDLDCGIECDPEDDLSEAIPIPTSKAALEAIQVLQMYALGCGDEEVLGGNFKLQNYLLVVAARNTQEQREFKISDYFTNYPK